MRQVENLPKIRISEEEKKRLDLVNRLNAIKNGTRPSQVAKMLQPNSPKEKQTA